jgi:hypothetical protein
VRAMRKEDNRLLSLGMLEPSLIGEWDVSQHEKVLRSSKIVTMK